MRPIIVKPFASSRPRRFSSPEGSPAARRLGRPTRTHRRCESGAGPDVYLADSDGCPAADGQLRRLRRRARGFGSATAQRPPCRHGRPLRVFAGRGAAGTAGAVRDNFNLDSTHQEGQVSGYVGAAMVGIYRRNSVADFWKIQFRDNFQK